MSVPKQQSLAITSPPSSSDPKQELVTAIRGWVHMDNLVESFNRQATNARQLRAKHETDAIRLIKQLGLNASQIQVSGGATLQLATRRSSETLTWSFLEREAHAWAEHAGLTPTQSAGLIKWLHEHRDSKSTEYLKKSGAN